MKKVLITGAGPAGISASLYIIRSGIAEVIVCSHGESALMKAESIENYFGFAEPVSGQELLMNSRKGAERLGVIFRDEELIELQMTADMRFEALTDSGSDIYDAVMLATGTKRERPSFSGVKEFEGRGVSYCAVCDAFFYRGKPVVVIGSGEYAVHEAAVLKNTSSTVTILTDGAEMKLPLPDGVLCDTRKIAEIAGTDRVERVVFSDGKALETAGAFIAVGIAGSGDIARKLGAATENGKIVVDNNMASTIPGLFAGGDCIGGLLQVSKAVADGAVAGMSIVKHLKKMDR